MSLPNDQITRPYRLFRRFLEPLRRISLFGAAKDKHPGNARHNSIIISHVTICLFLLSAFVIIQNELYEFVTGGENISSKSESVAPPSILHAMSNLSVTDYEAVLVEKSEPFRIRGDSKSVGDSQSSLVSAPAETEVTQAGNHDSDEDPVARLIVITMDREQSLRRLLDSLVKANYGEDHVDLDIWIDVAEGRQTHEGVLHQCRGIEWKQGTKTIHKRTSNAGLYQQWIYTWNITVETTEFAVILEDDLEVSPAFYQWLRVARAAYAQDPDVGAFTLQRSTLRPRQVKNVAWGPLNIGTEHSVFKYRLLGTWGFAPQRDQWVEFRKWFEEKRSNGEKPYVENLITTEWYKTQEINGFAPNMWSQWWIKFVDEKGYFTLTPNLADGTTLAANWREAGLHYSKNSQGADFPIFRGNDEQFVMPDNPVSVDWDGQVLSPNVMPLR